MSSKEKKKIKKILKILKPAVYQYKNTDKKSFGFIAQDVEKIFPMKKYDMVQVDGRGFLMINYYQFIPILFFLLKKIKKKLKKIKKNK